MNCRILPKERFSCRNGTNESLVYPEIKSPEFYIAFRKLVDIPRDPDITFKSIKYTVVNSSTAHNLYDLTDNLITDQFVGYQMSGFSTYSSTGIEIVGLLKKKKQTDLLQKLRSTLAACYAASVPDKEIQRIWNFELVGSVHDE